MQPQQPFQPPQTSQQPPAGGLPPVPPQGYTQPPSSQAPVYPLQPEQQAYYQPQPNTGRPMQPPQPTTPQPASWYTPPQKEANTKPASVDDYLGRTPAQPQPGAQPASAPGQMINGQYAVDYLGGIAPQQPKPGITIAGFTLSKRALMVIIGGTVALLLAAMLMIFSQKPQAVSQLNESNFYSHLIRTQEITKDGKKNIKNSKLRAHNGTLQTLLVGSASEMATPLQKSGMDPKKLESEAKKPSDEDKKLLNSLNDARLNAVYDRAYVREMTHRLNTMLLMLDRIEKINSRESMQQYVKSTRPKLKDIQKAISETAL